ncbi:MAG: hypothetical protein ABI867_05590 [Kofleriaceae bacterium]
MTALVAASPPSASLLAACRELGPLELWAPLAAPAWLARVPGALGRYASRRALAGDITAPAVFACEAALRAWARDRTDRRYHSELVLRLAIDAWAAREVRRREPAVVVASTLAARATFAAARAIGATCVLVIDLPLLRALHRDLDRAAAVWPERRFLQRFRAPAWAIARQEAERVLADRILVRGAYARSLCLADGLSADRIVTLATPANPVVAPPRTGRVRLAGLAAARTGIDIALAVARRLGLELAVRTGEGTEPANLATLPGVTTAAGPVDAILCPAICETYAPELATTGIPVIASTMAGGHLDPYDAAAFVAALG